MSGFETIEADGKPFRLYSAGDPGPGRAGVVLFHPWWGLNDDVLAYSDGLAAAGFTVVAPDMFGGQVASTVEGAEQLAKSADEEAINGIALATVDHLAKRIGRGAKMAAIGFSFGAHWAMWTPAQRDKVVASVLYYGTTDGPFLMEASVPVLGHFADNDPYETAEWVSEFEQTLRSGGREVIFHSYPGTGHWFAEPSRDAYRAEAADLAFTRTVKFLERQLS